MARFALAADAFVLPDRLARGGYLVVEDGQFGAWSEERPACDVVDLGDAWVAPGYVDTHIHGFYGHATTDADAAGLHEASRELARRGTTSWLPTTFTDGAEQIADACEAIADAAQMDDGTCAHIQGIYLEGPFFSEKHKGAQNPAYLRDPDIDLLHEWQCRARGLIRKSALAPERAGSLTYTLAATSEGVRVCLGHNDATFDEAMAAVEAGASVFVHTYNGMSGFTHREPGCVGAAWLSEGTYAEVICDGLHSRPEAVKVLLAMRGWEHVVPISDCLGCGGLPEGNYMSGGLPVVMRDDACYLVEGGNLAGSVLVLAKGVRNLADWGLVTPEQAVRMATEVAATSAGIDDVCGSIREGRAADFNVLSPELDVRATYVNGTQVA